MVNSNYVTQDQRIDDLEDIAYLKKRVFELEEKVAKLESLIPEQKHKKHKSQVSAFLGYVPVKRKTVKKTDDFLEALGE